MKLFLCFAVVVAVVFALSNEQTATKDSHTATVQQTRTLTHTHAVRKINKGNATKTIHASHAPRTHTHKHIRTQSTLPILNLTQQKMPKIVTHAHCSALSLNFIRSPALSLSLFFCALYFWLQQQQLQHTFDVAHAAHDRSRRLRNYAHSSHALSFCFVCLGCANTL